MAFKKWKKKKPLLILASIFRFPISDNVMIEGDFCMHTFEIGLELELRSCSFLFLPPDGCTAFSKKYQAFYLECCHLWDYFSCALIMAWGCDIKDEAVCYVHVLLYSIKHVHRGSNFMTWVVGLEKKTGRFQKGHEIRMRNMLDNQADFFSFSCPFCILELFICKHLERLGDLWWDMLTT